jgi:hypothetical protein
MQVEATLIPIIAIVFSLSIPIVAIIMEHFTKKGKMRLMEKAIEKGMPLDGLSLQNMKGPRVPYRSGMVLLAVGLGVCIFALLVGQQESDAFLPLLGMASVPALIGIALIINDKINHDRLFNKESDPNKFGT